MIGGGRLRLPGSTIARLRTALAIVGLTVMADCKSPASSSVEPGASCTIAPGHHVIAEVDLGVGKSDGDGCEGVGGNAFDIAPGSVSAVATWSDPAAALKLEVWSDGFGRLLAVGAPVPGRRCSSASATAESRRIVVRVCHTRESGVPLAVRTDANTFTRYHLVVGQ
jgi:hypothetical protein